MKMPEKKDFSSQLLPQLASDYPPPIWSLSSPHLIIGYRWICRISFHIFHHICSKWQCSEPHIMYYTIFGSGFSTYLPLGVDQANLVIYTLNFVLVLLGNATCTGMMYTTADWSSRFLRNITAFASEFPHYWSAILKIRGGILQIREWTTARGVELIHLYSKGEQRSGMPMLGFWPSTLHCPQKFVISRYSWKPAHWHSIVLITGWRHWGCAFTRQWSHLEFCPNWVGQNSADAAGSTAHATWWHYPQFSWLQ